MDIVQATGRAMRSLTGKNHGLCARAALRRTEPPTNPSRPPFSRAEFDEVWDVLQSLQEQDDVLAEIIRAMREERGRTKDFDDGRFRERVMILGPQVSVEVLRKVITHCLH